MSDDEVKEPAGAQAIAFSSFRLDRRTGQLTRAGTPIPLRAKTWAVLLYLAERPGVLVTRDELLDALWPGVAVTPGTLTKSISELRRALADESAPPRIIETVHRRGVRFIAEVGSPAETDAGAATWQTRAARALPFVGRTAELRELAERLALARAGRRQIVFVTGPPGIGKSTLVEAFLSSALVHGAHPPVRIGRGACIEQHGTLEPYMPVLESLEDLTRRPDGGLLVELLRRVAPTWLAQMPWLIGDDAAALRRSLKAARSERMLREFAALIELLTMDEVLVLALEDLQWSDPSTVDLLSLLGQRSAPARLLVIGSYRPAEIAVQEHVLCHAVRTLQVRRRCAELPIHELDEGGVESYLHARFPGAELPLGLTRALHAHTDGNPLFISAVVEDMLSRGWILDTSPGWCFAIPSRQVELGVPDDVRRVIAAQFERLGPADQGLLQAASVAGAAFAARAIAVPLGWPLDDVETRCETLAQSQRFLRDAGSGPWPDGAVARRYGFVHELYRQVVYEQITAGGRQRLHRQIGEALEAAYGERATEIAGELAAHFERGQDVPRALRYLAAAAARAQLRFARREAATDLETAIVLANLLPDEGERHRRELDLRIALAPILLDVHGFASEVLARNCERAYELCEDVGTPAELFHIAYALGLVYGARGDAHRAPAMFERLDALAHSLGTAEHRLLVDSLMARAATHQGHFAEACRLARGALSIDLRGTPKGGTEFGTDAVVAAQTHCALALWFLGETDRATATMDHALTNAGGSGSVFTLAAALCHSAILALLCRDPAKGRGLAERAAALAAEHDLVYWSSMASALQGWASVQEGNALEAIGKLEAARAAHRSMGVGVFYTLIQAFLAEACLRAGEPEAGLAAVDEGLAVAETTLDRSYRAELYRLKGELLLARAAAGSAPEAEQCLRQALDLARAAEAKALELRAATSLARMLASRGDASVGATLLDTICQWFDTGARSPDLSEARALRKNFA